ncbi:P2X purinoceptor 1 [Pelobates cultripes]|uniref:P2X purinoceptor 1 n=1 Tax=Pelobates cultripes TaxID=61616 RepID=A0AAD1R325_PELCU|nr:P2X purinoceptor 1 [Pelobates cultripes]
MTWSGQGEKMGHKIRKNVSNFFFEYDTPRMVLVRDKKVGLTFRLIQFGVLCYIVGWVFLYEKGYQNVDGIISSVSIKMKGLAITNLEHVGTEIWDAADYVFPPQGDSSFVVMTNFIITREQQMGYCNERPEVATCKSDDDCKVQISRQSQDVHPLLFIFSNTLSFSTNFHCFLPLLLLGIILLPLSKSSRFTHGDV